MKPVVELGLAFAIAACARPPADHPSRIDADDAIVYLTVSVAAADKSTVAVPDAALWVDGIFVGSVADLRRGFAIQPGRHRVELHHDAYWSHYQVLDLGPAQRLKLTIELAPTLP